jgi:hypothetical protein
MPLRGVGLTLLLALAVTLSGASAVQAHRSGCHRWHSCPSDHGTYECGDLGYCSACSDNQYCLLGKPRREPKEDERKGQSNKTTQQAPERENQK